MRLNKILLLAATINILIFALAFTISCSSGDTGNAGKDGNHCIVDDDWYIICNGDKKNPLGPLVAGNGTPGLPGNPGKQGDGCWLGDKTDTGYEILCGSVGSAGEVKGTLDGCSVTYKSKFEIDIVCGSAALGLCNGVPFNPDSSFCSQTASDATVITLDDSQFEWCGDVRININKQYCGHSKNEDAEAQAQASTVYDICGYDKSNTPIKPNKDSWDYQYCQYTDEKIARLAGSADGTDYCEGNLDSGAVNKDYWKKEYCGWPDKSNKRKVLQGVCDSPGDAITGYDDASGEYTTTKAYGPSEVAAGQGYCEVKWADRNGVTVNGKKTYKTTYSENLCGVTGTPNNKEWKNEYCGYAAPNDLIPTAIFKDMCDDGTRPYGRTDVYEGLPNKAISYDYSDVEDPGFNTDKKRYFCGIQNKKKSTQRPGITGTTLLQYCEVKSGSASTWTKYNDGSWKNEYCGFKKGIGWTASNGNDAGGYTYYGDKKKVAPGSNAISPKPDTLYKNQTGFPALCDDGKGAFLKKYDKDDNNGLDPDDDDNFWNGYCIIDYSSASYDPAKPVGDAPTKITTVFCGDSSRAVPKGGYCGKNKASSKDSVHTAGTCTKDGKGPHYGTYESRFCGYESKADVAKKATVALPYCVSGTTKTKYNTSGYTQYCGYKDANSANVDKVYSNLCDDGEKPNAVTTDKGNSAGRYCTWATPSATGTTITTDRCTVNGQKLTLNENGWNGEYCVGNSAAGYKRLSCKGGQVPAEETNPDTKCTVPKTDQTPPVITGCTGHSDDPSTCSKQECEDYADNYGGDTGNQDDDTDDYYWDGGECKLTSFAKCEYGFPGFSWAASECARNATSAEISAGSCSVGDMTEKKGDCKAITTATETACGSVPGSWVAGNGDGACSWTKDSDCGSGYTDNSGTCESDSDVTHAACLAAAAADNNAVATWDGEGTCTATTATPNTAFASCNSGSGNGFTLTSATCQATLP